MADGGAPAADDARLWLGRLKPGHEAEHERFVEWLNGPEAAEIFRRRRLNEYALFQRDDALAVIFTLPRTGDPRIVIDFLRYPGLWPEYWEFVRGGRAEEAPEPVERGTRRAFWNRDERAKDA